MNPLGHDFPEVTQRLSPRDTTRLGGTHSTGWLRSRAAFFRELWDDPRSVGAICPSSGELGRRMARWANPAAAGWTVELGGGTGTVTQALLQGGVPRERLIVIERSRQFVTHLRGRFPGVRIIHADAADLARLVPGGGSVAAIVSGLPLRSLPPDTVSRVVQACSGVLGPSSRVVQFTYAPRACSAWRSAGLHRIANEAVWRNLPPARIEVFTPVANPGLR